MQGRQFRAFGPIGVVNPSAWWNEVEVNLRGPLLYAHAVLPSMRARHRGRIINVASIAGVQAIPALSAYVVSKTALIRFTEALAQETAADGVQVFAIHPGTVRTPMNAYVHDSPEVAESAPHIQQWFRTLFAEGRDMPSSVPYTLCCDWPLAMPMRSPVVIFRWRMTLTRYLSSLLPAHLLSNACFASMESRRCLWGDQTAWI